MGPFATQMVNFVAINIGALLSSLLMPKLTGVLGESNSVTITGFVALVLFLFFLITYHLEY